MKSSVCIQIYSGNEKSTCTLYVRLARGDGCYPTWVIDNTTESFWLVTSGIVWSVNRGRILNLQYSGSFGLTLTTLGSQHMESNEEKHRSRYGTNATSGLWANSAFCLTSQTLKLGACWNQPTSEFRGSVKSPGPGILQAWAKPTQVQPQCLQRPVRVLT